MDPSHAFACGARPARAATRRQRPPQTGATRYSDRKAAPGLGSRGDRGGYCRSRRDAAPIFVYKGHPLRYYSGVVLPVMEVCHDAYNRWRTTTSSPVVLIAQPGPGPRGRPRGGDVVDRPGRLPGTGHRPARPAPGPLWPGHRPGDVVRRPAPRPYIPDVTVVRDTDVTVNPHPRTIFMYSDTPFG